MLKITYYLKGFIIITVKTVLNISCSAVLTITCHSTQSKRFFIYLDRKGFGQKCHLSFLHQDVIYRLVENAMVL